MNKDPCVTIDITSRGSETFGFDINCRKKFFILKDDRIEHMKRCLEDARVEILDSISKEIERLLLLSSKRKKFI